jgi:cAMP-dependent protein kinase regulator
MYNAQRAATVTATSQAKLWALDRESFQMMLSTAENTKKRQYEGFLESVAILQDLTKYELARLSDMLDSQLFDKDEPIITQGEEGAYFYILEDGEAKAFIGGERGEIEVKHYSQPGDYFGEIALLKSATRRATVRAAGEGCSVLSVSRDDFDSVLGPIKDILGKNIDKYPEYADFIRQENAKAEDEAAEKEKIEQMKDTTRRQGVSAPAITEERMKDWKRPSYPKPADVVQRIKDVISTNSKLQVLFGHLQDSAVLDVIDAMQPQTVETGDRLITQGEDGDFFYIVDEGTFDVFVQRGDQEPGKVADYCPGGMFGELGLMYNAPRAATVLCTSPAKVWALDRGSFQLMLTTAENTRHATYGGFLENIDLFRHLTRYETAQLSDMLESEPFEAGEEIIKQGDVGNYFYIVEDGEAKAFMSGEQGEVEVKHYSTPGDYFGEVALITQDTRRATVRACGNGCSVLSVSRDDFDRVLGPIKDILITNIDNYPAYADVLREAMAGP